MKIGAMVYLDGLIAGMIGAAIIAIWFLFLDAVIRLPFYTPIVLGEGLFLRGQDLASTEGVQVSLKLILMYTGVHGLVFMVLGVIAAYFLLLTRKKLNLGLWILLIFVVLEFGFVGTAFVFAEPVLHELAWPMVLIANLLAATGMASYLGLRHPELRAQGRRVNLE
jgi:hypothetical protein